MAKKIYRTHLLSHLHEAFAKADGWDSPAEAYRQNPAAVRTHRQLADTAIDALIQVLPPGTITPHGGRFTRSPIYRPDYLTWISIGVCVFAGAIGLGVALICAAVIGMGAGEALPWLRSLI